MNLNSNALKTIFYSLAALSGMFYRAPFELKTGTRSYAANTKDLNYRTWKLLKKLTTYRRPSNYVDWCTRVGVRLFL